MLLLLLVVVVEKEEEVRGADVVVVLIDDVEVVDVDDERWASRRVVSVTGVEDERGEMNVGCIVNGFSIRKLAVVVNSLYDVCRRWVIVVAPAILRR